MLLLIHAEQDETTIADHLGEAEYSYYFVLREFRRLLEQMTTVLPVRDYQERHDSAGRLVGTYRVDRVVDAVHRLCRAEDEPCLFLSFSPPHRTPDPLECPAVPVFAWEYHDLPTEVWNQEPCQDWRVVLARSGRAITHSEFACRVVKRAMGARYPVVSIPAPVWSRFARLVDPQGSGPDLSPMVFETDGLLSDTRPVEPQAAGTARAAGWTATVTLDTGSMDSAGARASRSEAPKRVELRGVLYTSIFNPDDGRKNWIDLLRAFCVALRDRPDAMLLLKFVHSSPERFRADLALNLSRLRPMRCRVVVFSSFLSDLDYERLARRTTYVVNASHGEGQCLPLMEFMSCGTPAVAPPHTGMADYVGDDNAFLVGSNLEPAAWPHDPRKMIRTFRHRIDLEALMSAFRESYAVAIEKPDVYRAMSAAAIRRLEAHCSDDVVSRKLQAFIDGWHSALAPEDASAGRKAAVPVAAVSRSEYPERAPRGVRPSQR